MKQNKTNYDCKKVNRNCKEIVMELENIQNEIITQFIKKTDEKLMEFITPYLRIAGIKGEITKGKIKWRGIKMKVHSDCNSTKYQLNQRGIDISPIFEIKNKL